MESTKLNRILGVLGAENNDVQTPCTCSGGLVEALVNRQRLLDPARPKRINERFLRGYRVSVYQMYQKLYGLTQSKSLLTYEQCVERYSGPKREMYARSLAELRYHDYSHDVFFPAMVKWGERTARYRCILPQAIRAKGVPGVTKEGQVLLAPILTELPGRLLLEEGIHGLRNFDGSRMIASGSDLNKRARVIRSMVRPGWTCFSFDFSSFDGSLGQVATEERLAFRRFMERRGECDPWLVKTLRTQEMMVVDTRDVKARIAKNRGSGTAGTSIGNKICALSALQWAVGRANDLKAVKYYCDGDDTLLVVRNDQLPFMSSWRRRLMMLGLESKIENIATSPEEVVFCRAQPIDTVNGPFLCKRPLDAMMTQTNLCRHWRGDSRRFADYLATLHVGFRDVYAGVPVLGQLCKLFPMGGRVDKELLAGSGIEYLLKNDRRKRSYLVTDEARVSFAAAFGISCVEQQLCEKWLSELGDELAPQWVDKTLWHVRNTPHELCY